VSPVPYLIKPAPIGPIRADDGRLGCPILLSEGAVYEPVMVPESRREAARRLILLRANRRSDRSWLRL